jgi:hypothetical protein
MRRFYLGTHEASWLADPRFAFTPLFVSRRRLVRYRRRLPRALGEWALDSGGFTELSMYGRWTVGAAQYVSEVRRFRDEVGGMLWAAPQDWMCEPMVLERTGLTVTEHQQRTVENLLELRALAPDLPWTPVLQGFTNEDYQRCRARYADAGVLLEREPLVGLGTICRRQGTLEAEDIVRDLRRAGLRIHAFGAKTTGLVRYAAAVESADSLAWSFGALKQPPLPGCTHTKCNNCPLWALRWCRKLHHRLDGPPERNEES